jgi:hypothetical protein
MPHPLSTILKDVPKERVSIGWQPDNAAKQPELAVLVTQAISIWSLVDCTLGQILVDILGAKAGPAVAMYDALLSSAAQIEAIKAAAKYALCADNHKLFQALMRIYKSEAKQRHKFAHWIWAYCEQAAEYLVLIKPSRIVHGHTAMSELIHKQATTVSEKFTIPWGDEYYAYSKEELHRIVGQFSEVLNLFRWFQSLVRPLPSPLKDQAYRYLITNSQITTALSHLFPSENGASDRRDTQE